MTDRAGSAGLSFVGVGGAVRPGSSTESALRIALGVLEAAGARTELISGPGLDLPLYLPERSQRTPEARRLIEALRRADGVLIASPAYHGSMSGLIKNALDYAEDLCDDPWPYLHGRAVGCIATGAGWQGVSMTLFAMRSLVHALRGWPTPLGAALNTSEAIFSEDGTCLSPVVQAQLELVATQVLDFARWRRAAGADLR